MTRSSRGTQDETSKSTDCVVSTTPDLVGQVSSVTVSQNMTYLGQILEPHLGFCLISKNKSEFSTSLQLLNTNNYLVPP